MDDSISRKNAINKLKEHRALFCRNRIEFRGLPKDEKCRVDEIDACISVLRNLPSAERVGHWIQISPAKIYECSVCGQNVKTDDIDCYKYCHGCGARMKGEKQ